jgi:hypothetical protein
MHRLMESTVNVLLRINQEFVTYFGERIPEMQRFMEPICRMSFEKAQGAVVGTCISFELEESIFVSVVFSLYLVTSVTGQLFVAVQEM